MEPARAQSNTNGTENLHFLDSQLDRTDNQVTQIHVLLTDKKIKTVLM